MHRQRQHVTGVLWEQPACYLNGQAARIQVKLIVRRRAYVSHTASIGCWCWLRGSGNEQVKPCWKSFHRAGPAAIVCENLAGHARHAASGMPTRRPSSMLCSRRRPSMRPPTRWRRYAVTMGCMAAAVTSRLFPERAGTGSLCYYCSSSFQSFTGNMCVQRRGSTPTQPGPKAIRELMTCAAAHHEAEELEDCRRLLSGMAGIETTLGGSEPGITWRLWRSAYDPGRCPRGPAGDRE